MILTVLLESDQIFYWGSRNLDQYHCAQPWARGVPQGCLFGEQEGGQQVEHPRARIKASYGAQWSMGGDELTEDDFVCMLIISGLITHYFYQFINPNFLNTPV